MRLPLNTLSLFVLILAGAAARAEEVLVVEQDYNIVEHGKDGPQARDLRQKLFIHRDAVCIDEYGGEANVPTETTLIDISGQKIVTLDHEKKNKVTETFAERRARIERRKRNAKEDLENHPAGPNRDKLVKLYRAMLDDNRTYRLVPLGKKDLNGIPCEALKVVDAAQPDYAPMEASLYTAVDLPYDSAEMLYLLQIIGENMAGFLRQNKDTFKKLPVELHLDLPLGGRLDTRVLSVHKVEKAKIDVKVRPLGDPFVEPAYPEKMKGPGKRPEKGPVRPD